jgi:Calcineurin-like phosphoesterase
MQLQLGTRINDAHSPACLAAGRSVRHLLIVTLHSVPGNLESVARRRTAAPIDPIQQAAIMNRYNRILERLEEATRPSSQNVLITVPDRDTSMLQSCVGESAEDGQPLPTGGLEAKFGDGPRGGDIWGWFRSLFDHIDSDNWHPIVRPPDDKAADFANTGRVAVLSDWGTNLYGAPISAESIKGVGGYELLLHLGDIYYSGTSTEVKERFLDVWPIGAGKMSRALNGNHEMYSGGFAYFDEILPKFHQASSYFALQNSYWLLIGLDTAHTDHAIDAHQATWVRSVLQKAGPRKLILFSHHQPFSRLDKQGPKLQTALAELLANKAIIAWYWGHEHDCVIYDNHEPFGMLGRCIGHGGIPAPRKAEVIDAPTERQLNCVSWKRLSADANSPSCLVLDGPNPLITGEEQKFGPHGYLTLEFDGPHLTERVHLPHGTEIFKQLIA